MEVRASGIVGRGVFALRRFEVGEVVLEWRPVGSVGAEDVRGMPEQARHYLIPAGDGTFLVMGEPERFVNHSCDANTSAVEMADVAVRAIEIGEEITSNYSRGNSLVRFDCRCGAVGCVGVIG